MTAALTASPREASREFASQFTGLINDFPCPNARVGDRLSSRLIAAS
jgi:hypothetical protein